MFHRFKFWLLAPLVIGLIHGCATVSSKSDPGLSQSSTQMLKEQQFLLAHYAERMDELLEAHHSLAAKVESLQQDVSGVNHLVATELKALRDNQGKGASKPTKPVAKRYIESPPSVAPNKMVLGRLEWVWFDLLVDSLKARIDTGAMSSSLDCDLIQPFERNGEKWVRFQMVGFNEGQILESPMVRKAKSRNNGDYPVVKLTVRLGTLAEETEFTLLKRKNSTYPVLLGRNFLRDIALVDVAQKYTQAKYSSVDKAVASP